MSTLLINAYTQFKNLSCSKQIQELLEQNNYSKQKSTSKNIFHAFKKWHFLKFTNRMNGAYERI